jgi:hypothetical protein
MGTFERVPERQEMFCLYCEALLAVPGECLRRCGCGTAKANGQYFVTKETLDICYDLSPGQRARNGGMALSFRRQDLADAAMVKRRNRLKTESLERKGVKSA